MKVRAFIEIDMDVEPDEYSDVLETATLVSLTAADGAKKAPNKNRNAKIHSVKCLLLEPFECEE